MKKFDKKEECELIAEKVLNYNWNEERGVWERENGWTNWFNPFDVNDDCEKVKEKLREDGWLLTIQDKMDYMGDYISSGKIFHKNFKVKEDHYTETINDRYTVCHLALKAYGIK